MTSPRSCMPRQMLPPPTTMPISTPESTASLISATIEDSASGRMPWEPSLQRDSPESLRRTRLYFLAEGILARLPAERVADEADDLDLAAGLGARRLDEVADRGLRLLDEGLLEQAERLEEQLVDLALEDLGDLRLGLAFLLQDVGLDRLLRLDVRGGDL